VADGERMNPRGEVARTRRFKETKSTRTTGIRSPGYGASHRDEAD
jgi:hypothetical protein